ncbi:putative exporter [Alteromonadaceae bacterium 2753L.S.0a.02]|nr:putative exporter [Alteromonadaceae bacterium 2753L.S.0a.02]
MRNWISWLVTLIAVISLYIVVPVQFNADVFDLLPKGAATVEGLQRYQHSFGSSEAVILTLECDDAEILDSVVPELAMHFQNNGIAKSAVWQNPLGENQQALGELIAYLWLNAPPEKLAELQEKLSTKGLETQLQDTLERIGASFNAGEIAQLANDPLGLTDIAQGLANTGKNPFASRDGKLRVLILSYPNKASHYFAYKKWLDSIDRALRELRDSRKLPNSVRVGKTGNPVFVTEFGSQLIKDLSLAAVGTLLIVMLLFWWAHRSWRALAWLSAGLALTLALTILIGSSIFGALNAVSFGFAALLMGLAVDYGLIVYQELRSNPALSANQLRKHLSPSILWAALTTAGAFFMLTRSSLPGLMQLGLLVAIGIIVAALMVLYLFLPAVAGKSAAENMASKTWILPKNWVATITVAMFIAAIIIIWLIPPSIVTDVAKLQFNNNEAQRVHDHMQSRLGEENAQLWLILDAEKSSQIADTLQQIQTLIDQSDLNITAKLPTALWPILDYQQNNINTLASLADERQRFASQVESAGFRPESLGFSEVIFKAWLSFAKQSGIDKTRVLWPQNPANIWLYSQFSSEDKGHWYALGQVAADKLTTQQLQQFAQRITEIPGAKLVGWTLLADELAKTMVDDVIKVLLPMLVALTLLLAGAFRHWVDVLLSFASLAFGLLLLAAVMSLCGWHWNIINLTALPLLLGAGVDYSIHIQLALKRYNANLTLIFRAVGRAILLCGASTAVAFASLGLGSNAGIASLGKVTAAGIIIMALSAVLLLPQWWLILRRPSTENHNEST